MLWGCTIPSRFPFIEKSTRVTLAAAGIELRGADTRFMDSVENIDRWGLPAPQGLYDPRNEKDSCGVGFVCDIAGKASHSIVERGIEVLNHLLHRGAAGADAGTGDGAGILVQIPHRFFEDACRSLGFSLPQVGRYGAAMMFMPLEPETRMACQAVVDKALAGEGLARPRLARGAD